nr:MAG TPA: hypothetical protein [Caudoviricetes sp.]
MNPKQRKTRKILFPTTSYNPTNKQLNPISYNNNITI